jgi:hypothetical protein
VEASSEDATVSDEQIVKTYGSGSGSLRLYAIEARTTYTDPHTVNGMVLTKEWRRLHVHRIDGGQLACADPREVASVPLVPSGGYHLPGAQLAEGLIEKEQALLLAARFQMGANGRVEYCVETRVIEVELNYSFATKEIGVSEPYSLFDASRRLKVAPRCDEANQGATGRE